MIFFLFFPFKFGDSGPWGQRTMEEPRLAFLSLNIISCHLCVGVLLSLSLHLAFYFFFSYHFSSPLFISGILEANDTSVQTLHLQHVIRYKNHSHHLHKGNWTSSRGR